MPEWERIANEMRLVGEQLVNGRLTVDEAAAELDRRADAHPREAPLDARPRARCASGAMKRARLAGWVFAAPALAVIALFFVLPVLAAFALSLTDFDIYALADLRNLRFVGLGNYVGLLQNPLFWKALGNTLYFVVVGVPLSIARVAGRGAAAAFAGWRASSRSSAPPLRAGGDDGGRGGGDLALPVPHRATAW